MSRPRFDTARNRSPKGLVSLRARLLQAVLSGFGPSVIWLEDGRIIEQGRPSELLQDPGTHFAKWMGDKRLPRSEQKLEVPT